MNFHPQHSRLRSAEAEHRRKLSSKGIRVIAHGLLTVSMRTSISSLPRCRYDDLELCRSCTDGHLMRAGMLHGDHCSLIR